MDNKSIRTFVFFDLETTGLPHLDSTTKITELALVAADRDEIIRVNEIGISGDLKENNLKRSGYLPRVISKVNLPIYPSKLIHPRASHITGLNNEILKHKKPFDENVYQIITSLMESLSKPICLVAHNGYRFDFPILQSELANINRSLSEDIYCVDSLSAFRAVLDDHFSSKNDKNNVFDGIQPLDDGIEDNKLYRACDLVPKCGWSCEDYDSELVLVAEIAETESNKCKSFVTKELESKIQREVDRIRKLNERTPKKSSKIKSDHTIASGSTAEFGSEQKQSLEKSKPKAKMTYNLKSVFENVTGRPLVEFHQAEADTLALLECVTVIGRPILEWMDKHRIPFKSIRKLW